MLNIAFFQDKDKISHLAFLKAKRELLDKALAMEREQIKDAYMDGESNYYSIDDAKVLAQHYYQCVYGKEAGNANG